MKFGIPCNSEKNIVQVIFKLCEQKKINDQKYYK